MQKKRDRYNSVKSKSLTVGLSCMVIVIIICLTRILSDCLIMIYESEAEQISIVVSTGEVVTAIVAAVVIIWQLNQEQAIQERQQKTQEAQFILEYNRSFIESAELCMIEHYLEKKITGDMSKEIKNLHENRQALINYLVYLAGIASCVHGKNLEIEYIDDLFAYRFFLAMNNPEVQELELVSYASFYRGCYQLYEKWIRFRRESGKYKGDIEIPLEETSLEKCKGYETYLEFPIEISGNDKERKKPHWLSNSDWRKASKWEEMAFAVRESRIVGIMFYKLRAALTVGGIFVKPGTEKRLIQSALLKSVLYHEPNKKIIISAGERDLDKLLKELQVAKEIIEKDRLRERIKKYGG